MRTATGLLLASLFSACATMGPQTVDDRTAQSRDAVAHWDPASKLTAAAMIEKYGPADRIEDGHLEWSHVSPWDRIEVWNLTASPDDLEQAFSYKVPDDERADLADFSEKLHVSEDGWQISVRGPSEAANFLMMNLAVEIAKGYIKPDEARRTFAKTMDLRASGKNSPWTQGLVFPPETLEPPNDWLTPEMRESSAIRAPSP